MNLNVAVLAAFCGFPFVVFFLFATIPVRRALLLSLFGGWLFLPMAAFGIAGLPDISKTSLTTVSIFLASLFFYLPSYNSFRVTWMDLPMCVWLLSPLPAAILNDFGVYRGFSNVLALIFTWGLPYLLGRVFFRDREAMLELAVGMCVAAAVYLPLVAFELRMSPQLHTWVYGYHQHTFAQSRKGDGWRPTVFMQHGLAVSIFMCSAAVSALWLWRTGAISGLIGLPMGFLSVTLFVGAVACKSSYAILLIITGIGGLLISKRLNTRLILALLVAFPPVYMVARTVGNWEAKLLLDAATLMKGDQARSLRVRLNSETHLWQWIQGNQVFGRGDITKVNVESRALNTENHFIPDGMWIIALGKNGWVGLSGLFGSLLLPIAAYFLRFGPADLFSTRNAGATASATILLLHSMDNLQNAMTGPVFLIIGGGLVSLCMFVDDFDEDTSLEEEYLEYQEELEFSR